MLSNNVVIINGMVRTKDSIGMKDSKTNDEEPMTKADREKYLELVTKLLEQAKGRNASPDEIRVAETLVQRAKEKLAGMKDAEEVKGQVIISSQDMARYNELKAMGYVTLWTGEGKIAMAPRRTKDASSDEYIVNVGNVGNIVCTSEQEALKTFNEYVRQSKSTSGRAAGEDVVLFKNGYPIKDFVGSRTLSGEDAMSVNEYQTKVQELRNQAKKAREEGNMARFNEIAKQIEDLTKEYNTKDEDLKEKLIRLAEEAGDKQYADDIRNGKVPLSQSELVRRIDWYTTRTVGDAEFEESKHKRDNSGKFSSTGEGGGGKVDVNEKKDSIKAQVSSKLSEYYDKYYGSGKWVVMSDPNDYEGAKNILKGSVVVRNHRTDFRAPEDAGWVFVKD